MKNYTTSSLLLVAALLGPAALAAAPAKPAATPAKAAKAAAPDAATKAKPAAVKAERGADVDTTVEGYLPIPPLKVEEITVQPTEDEVWIPGYWERGSDWTWVKGEWTTPPNKKARWHPGHWRFDDTVWNWMPGQWVVIPGFYVSETHLYDIAKQPGYALAAAKTELAEEHLFAAATELRGAARSIRDIDGRELIGEFNGADRADLSARSKALEAVAKSLEEGGHVSASNLNQEIESTEVALARHFRLMAAEDAMAGKPQLAGRALQSAVFHFQMAMGDKNANPQAETQMDVRLAHKVAENFINGSATKEVTMDPAVAALKEAIKREFGA